MILFVIIVTYLFEIFWDNVCWIFRLAKRVKSSNKQDLKSYVVGMEHFDINICNLKFEVKMFRKLPEY